MTVGERPMRVIFLSASIHFGGVFVGVSPTTVATVGLSVMTAFTAVGLVQLLLALRQQLSTPGSVPSGHGRRHARYVGATVVAAGLGTVLVSLLMGTGLALGYGWGMGEWGRFAGQIGGQLSYLPGVLFVASVAVAVVGLSPHWSPLAWAGVAFVALQVTLGETLRLPTWIDAVSPFWHLPGVPIETFSARPAAVQLVLAAGLALLGLWGYQRRDLDAA